MSPRSFLPLALFTVLAVVAALLAVTGRAAYDARLAEGRPLFEDFANLAQKATTIEIVTGDYRTTLQATQAGWILPSQNSYPVDTAKLADLLRSLARLQLLEERSDDPDRFVAMQLLEPDGTVKHGGGRRVTMKDGAGTVLVDLILGAAEFRMGTASVGEAAGALYLRQAAENQAWLAEGRVELPRSEKGWLDTTLVNYGRDVFRSATWKDGGGAVIAGLTRAEAGAEPVLAPLPEGREPDGTKTDRVPALLAALSFEEVRPVDGHAGADPRETVVVTADGRLEVTLRSTLLGEETWVQLRARALEGAPPEVVAEAEAITAETRAWIYTLPGFKRELLRLSLDELTRPAASAPALPQPAETPAPAAPAAAPAED